MTILFSLNQLLLIMYIWHLGFHMYLEDQNTKIDQYVPNHPPSFHPCSPLLPAPAACHSPGNHLVDQPHEIWTIGRLLSSIPPLHGGFGIVSILFLFWHLVPRVDVLIPLNRFFHIIFIVEIPIDKVNLQMNFYVMFKKIFYLIYITKIFKILEEVPTLHP